jgi:hypothetical protein
VKPARLATCEDSRTTIIGVAHIWDCRGKHQSHGGCKHQKPGGSWRSLRWASSIIVTNGAPPEPAPG